ncbi:MAG: hypothetical protein KBS34_04045 [Phascolarctobacterium sp.]|nr:hypothetical protein [Candidatus Phascolarctobacterium equi]
MNKRRGSVLIELLCVVGLLGLFLSYMVLQMGDVEDRLQNMQVNLAARRLIMDARGAQEYNMFECGKKPLKFLATVNTDNYRISVNNDVITRDKIFYFADFGCDKVYFKEKIIDLVKYTPTSSVNDEEWMKLGHKDGAVEVFINLQPVTGRIEIAQK